MELALFIDVDGVLTEEPINFQLARLLDVEKQVNTIEMQFRSNEISNDEFNSRLIPIFRSKKLTQGYIRDNFNNFRMRTYYDELLIMNKNVYLLSSGPSYFIEILAEKFSIPSDRVLCSKYEFDNDGIISHCSHPVSSFMKADFVREKSQNFDLVVGLGDNPAQDSAFLSHCDIRVLMDEFRMGYISVREIEPLIRLIQNLMGINKLTQNESAPQKINNLIFTRFHRIATKLTKRHDKRSTLTITDEYDVQDLLHSLLSLYFDDIRSEEWTPSYAGSSSRMDFLLKDSKIVIEVKKTRETLTDKKIGDELIIDIAHYQSHPDCALLICFVYDPERLLSNPKGLESDIVDVNKTKDFSVEMYIVP